MPLRTPTRSLPLEPPPVGRDVSLSAVRILKPTIEPSTSLRLMSKQDYLQGTCRRNVSFIIFCSNGMVFSCAAVGNADKPTLRLKESPLISGKFPEFVLVKPLTLRLFLPAAS